MTKEVTCFKCHRNERLSKIFLNRKTENICLEHLTPYIQKGYRSVQGIYHQTPDNTRLKKEFPEFFGFKLIDIREHNGVIFPDSCLLIYHAKTNTYKGTRTIVINYLWDNKLSQWVCLSRSITNKE